ncbi:nucleotide-binding universal stress UspA family protein [Herbaspirillum sp. Sphag1AN]|uniref:universal stress protein n=1 Tax=unclassified Herbaspirillum TaxID=2624150 RepID=UPI0016107CAA|nr:MULTISPECIES: universal stress protein [unclassified Herbaspirillum]MBB3212373.1 nucleotide-binding universal stress UspA family protein [Herbaspirillum sp. Sphag1AN]MBB3245528.1 nucleotide-binding universal stress UspA family protein [Herbaspirillum sp. Sphag64]
MYAKILVPVDGSRTSTQALDEAICLAKTLGSRVEVIHVVDNSYLLYDSGTAAPPGLHEAFVKAGMHILLEAKKRIVAAGLEGQVRIIENPITPGDIPATIVKDAIDCKAEMVAIGSHGQKGYREMMLGSVAEKVMHQCTVPVWIIRGSNANDEQVAKSA